MVLHLSTFHLEGGAGVAAARLHRALLKSGVDSHLLVQFPTASEAQVGAWDGTGKWANRRAWTRFAAERLAFYPNEKDASVRFAFSPAKIGVNLTSHPLVQQASVIHLHWVNFGYLSLDSLKSLFSLGKPVVWTLHDMWTFTGGCHYNRGCDHYLSHCSFCPFLARPARYDISFDQFEFKKQIYQDANLTLLSPSHWLDQNVKVAPLTEALPSLSIPNCIDTTLFKPLDKTIVRQQLNLPINKKLVLFTGANTQDPRKGFSYFKKAFELIGYRDDVEVLVLGKANNQAFENFPVTVHYLGKIDTQEKMVAAYNAANVLVAPSLEDNLPNTIMEAMACGVPVAGFRTGGIPEMIDHLHNGYVCEARSSESLAAGIMWVLENNHQGLLSLNAREKVLSAYSEAVVARQHSELYYALLHG